jgi:hypothetical protein
MLLKENNMKTLTIRIELDGPYSSNNLKIRHTLAETIEERGIGEIWNQGMGENYMDVSLDIAPSEEKENEIKSILQSLNLLERAEFIYE